MMSSKIEWTDETWNPIRRVGGGHACKKVSVDCANCYAERMQPRFGNGPGKYDGKAKIYLDEKVLTAPLRWRKPRRVFVCSMTDLFWSKVEDEWLARIFEVMALAHRHTFQVLTKRPERMRTTISDHVFEEVVCDSILQNHGREDAYHVFAGRGWPPPNVWLGVSAGNQDTWDARVPILCQIPAAVRFVSYEPALGPIKLFKCDCETTMETGIYPPSRSHTETCLNRIRRDGFQWLIAGGESGPHARPAHPDWFRSVRDQCQAAGIPFFYKQAGAWKPMAPQYGDTDSVMRSEDPSSAWFSDWGGHHICLENDGGIAAEWDGDDGRTWYQPAPNRNPWWLERVGKKLAGRLLDGREWNEIPTVCSSTARRQSFKTLAAKTAGGKTGRFHCA